MPPRAVQRSADSPSLGPDREETAAQSVAARLLRTASNWPNFHVPRCCRRCVARYRERPVSGQNLSYSKLSYSASLTDKIDPTQTLSHLLQGIPVRHFRVSPVTHYAVSPMLVRLRLSHKSTCTHSTTACNTRLSAVQIDNEQIGGNANELENIDQSIRADRVYISVDQSSGNGESNGVLYPTPV